MALLQLSVDIRVYSDPVIITCVTLGHQGSFKYTGAKMPSKERGTNVEAPRLTNTPMLKSHKALPKRRVTLGTSNSQHTLVHERSLEHLSDAYSYSSSERIRSWIPEPSQVQVVSDRGLPLTPPLNSNWIENRPSKDRVIATTYASGSSGVVTPVVQRSPPTPETTPPRGNNISHTIAATPAILNASSRTESFKTAREDLSSDDDTRQQDEPLAHPAGQQWQSTVGHERLKEIGLGLGLEPEERDAPVDIATRRAPSDTYDFVTFDGVWGGSREGLNTMGTDESQHSPRIGLVRRRKRPQISNRSSPISPKIGEEAHTDLMTPLSLRQRVERSRQTPPSASMERFAQQIQWSARDDDLDIDAKLREVDNRRLSQMSATSTVIEAMVIDSPPKRERTLRHTGRISTLNSLDNSLNHSTRSSVVSADYSSRRPLRHGKSPEGGTKRMYASESATSRTSSLAQVRHDTIPVIVIPKRRSSLKSSVLGNTF